MHKEIVELYIKARNQYKAVVEETEKVSLICLAVM